jgi:hypothetical protein
MRTAFIREFPALHAIVHGAEYQPQDPPDGASQRPTQSQANPFTVFCHCSVIDYRNSKSLGEEIDN